MHHVRRFGIAFAAICLWPVASIAADTIKIGFPIPLSGPTSVYGKPVLAGAEMAVAEINAKGGVLGKKLEILSRDSKANADESVRLARELIIKDNVDFLAGTLTSAEAPAVSTVAKENKIVFIAPTSKSTILTDPARIHPYIFRVSSNTDVEGLAGATLMARWKDVKTVATIAPDYAYGRDSIAPSKPALINCARTSRLSTSNGRNWASPTSPLSLQRRWARSPMPSIARCSPATLSPLRRRPCRAIISRP